VSLNKEVMLWVHSISPNPIFARNLFDGQTKELLAFANIERGKKAGMVFDRQHRSTSLANAGWDDASAYIDGQMADDRK
jgi:hypothetical protein